MLTTIRCSSDLQAKYSAALMPGFVGKQLVYVYIIGELALNSSSSFGFGNLRESLTQRLAEV